MVKRQIILDDNIPVPSKAISRKPDYPFDSMEVGISFFIPGGNQNTIHSAVTRYKKSEKGQGKDFTLRSVQETVKGEEDKGLQDGVRVWRTT